MENCTKTPELSCCCTNTLLSLFSANFVQSTLILYQIGLLCQYSIHLGNTWVLCVPSLLAPNCEKGPGGSTEKTIQNAKIRSAVKKKKLMKQKWRNEEWRKSEETNEARSSLKLLLVKLSPALFWIPFSGHVLYFLNLFLIFLLFLKMNFYYLFG